MASAKNITSEPVRADRAVADLIDDMPSRRIHAPDFLHVDAISAATLTALASQITACWLSMASA
jgi:hypothetical protein